MIGLIQFYYTHSFGHIRIVQKICRHFYDQNPNLKLIVLNGGKELSHDLWHWPSNVELINMPAFESQHGQFLGLKPVDESFSKEEVHSKRMAIFEELIKKHQFDFYLTEFFPFGRASLRKEFEAELKTLKEQRPNCSIYSVTREIVGKKMGLPGEEKWEKHKRRVNRSLKTFFDKIFVLGDQQLLCELDFPLDNENKEKLIFTGYLADPSSSTNVEPSKVVDKKTIFVQLAGGADGRELLEACIGCAGSAFGINYHWVVITGPSITNEPYGENVELFQSVTPEVVAEYRSHCHLQVSMCGYNSFVESITHPKRTLFVYRDFEPEQKKRAELVEHFSAIKVMGMDNISSDELTNQLCSLANGPLRDRILLNLNGGEFLVQSILQK
jgi:predicted glycosyltransferase